MSHFEEFTHYFDKGLRGESASIPIIDHPFATQNSKLGMHMDLSKSLYILFGGMPGTGKTAIVDSYFLLNIFLWWKRTRALGETDIVPYWTYRSMERAIFMKVAKWICYLMYLEYGVVIDVPTILCKSNALYDIKEKAVKIDGKDVPLTKIIKGYKEFFEDQLFKQVEIIPGSENPTGIKRTALRKAYTFGKYISCDGTHVYINEVRCASFSDKYTDYKNGELLKYVDLRIYDKNYRIFQYEKRYIEKDLNVVNFHISDHIGKLDREKFLYDPKQRIDAHSKNMGMMRDIFNWCIIDISQLNRSIEETLRQVKQGADIKPSDFKGSAEPYENADVVIGMLNPYKLNELDYGGYDIKSFVDERNNNRFRGLKVLKNSWGVEDLRLAYCFMGECGLIRELPRADEMSSDVYRSILSNSYGCRKPN